MFNKFRELFSSENLLDVAFDTTLKMIEFDHKMFDASRQVLRESDTDELPFDIRKTDRKINKYEREVRRNVLTHLSVAGTQNLVPGLVLVSIVIDVERIGDYTKNIVGLASLHKNMLKAGSHEEGLVKIETAIEATFPKIIDVLKSHDESSSRQILQAEPVISKIADTIISETILVRDDALSREDAVVLALYSRFLKRINAHLSNIASAIVNPFPRIGFREKDKKK